MGEVVRLNFWICFCGQGQEVRLGWGVFFIVVFFVFLLLEFQSLWFCIFKCIIVVGLGVVGYFRLMCFCFMFEYYQERFFLVFCRKGRRVLGCLDLERQGQGGKNGSEFLGVISLVSLFCWSGGVLEVVGQRSQQGVVWDLYFSFRWIGGGRGGGCRRVGWWYLFSLRELQCFRSGRGEG